jgi:hypothetical protein
MEQSPVVLNPERSPGQEIKAIDDRLAQIAVEICDLNIEANQLKTERMGLRYNVRQGTIVQCRGRDPRRRGFWTVLKIAHDGIFGYRHRNDDGHPVGPMREIPRPFKVVEG